MADYKEKFDDLHRAAKRKARELDEKLGVKGIVEEGARPLRSAHEDDARDFDQENPARRVRPR